jgi:hypothetical protein
MGKMQWKLLLDFGEMRHYTLRRQEIGGISQMGCRILTDREDIYAALYCSTSMWAFGPIFHGKKEAREFLDWLGVDPRGIEFTDSVLERKVSEFRAQRGDEEGE